MNIFEAFKSGKRVKRQCHLYWIDLDEGRSYTFEVRDLIADDWEVEPRVITRAQILEALEQCSPDFLQFRGATPIFPNGTKVIFVEKLLSLLGL